MTPEPTHTIGEAELMQRMGYTQRAALERALQRLGVKYFVARGGIWTTPRALDTALGLSESEPERMRIVAGGRVV